MYNTYSKDMLKCFIRKNAGESELWNRFLAMFYGNGHLQVPNTDPKTVGEYPTVTMLYLMQKDSVYRDDILNRYNLWLESTQKPVNVDKITTAPPTKIKFVEFDELEKDIKEEYSDVFGIDAPKEVLKKLKENLRNKTNEYLNRYNINDTKKISEALGVSILERNKISKNREIVVRPSFELTVENPDEPKVYSVTFDLKDRDVQIRVKHEEDEPESITLSLLYLNPNLHQKNIGLKLTTNLLGYAEKNKLDKVELLAYRNDDSRFGATPYVGYKVWPRLGFNGNLEDADAYYNEQSTKEYNLDNKELFFKFIEFIQKNKSPKLQKFYQDLKSSPIDPEYNTQFTMQNLYALGPEAIKIWEQIGSDISLSLSTDPNSRSNQIFKKYLQKKIDKNLQSLTEWYDE
jgi:hypothetical protein